MTTTATTLAPERVYRSTLYGHSIEVERHLDRLAYARNGNTHNPSRYYRWAAKVNGVLVTSSQATKRAATEVAHLYITSGEVGA